MHGQARHTRQRRTHARPHRRGHSAQPDHTAHTPPALSPAASLGASCSHTGHSNLRCGRQRSRPRLSPQTALCAVSRATPLSALRSSPPSAARDPHTPKYPKSPFASSRGRLLLGSGACLPFAPIPGARICQREPLHLDGPPLCALLRGTPRAADECSIVRAHARGSSHVAPLTPAALAASCRSRSPPNRVASSTTAAGSPPTLRSTPGWGPRSAAWA